MKQVLTDQDRDDIRKLHREGESIRGLAMWYGVSRGTIHYVIHPEAAEKNRVNNRNRQRRVRNTKQSSN